MGRQIRPNRRFVEPLDSVGGVEGIMADEEILISSDAWMTARNEIKVKSIGLKRLKSGQDIEMLECV